MRMKGLEPSQLSPLAPKASVSTISPHPLNNFFNQNHKYCKIFISFMQEPNRDFLNKKMIICVRSLCISIIYLLD